ncbi:transposase [Rhodanobacter sp. KK11]|jgi:putative transposase|uniref:transposase n=1 Tax=Rhodanobacter sp. KK11 TaxID=3083255 RepID=UPI002965E07D|nr:transposase [Rhodanobacter sp. KK11]MDW2982275.1 transposase [Rhodanobacter sp. KK11]
MPRQPRPDLADVPQHVVQRGNDRQPCFYVTDDYRRYLAGLRESAIRYGCSVHAYVLMTNHVHLLVTPSSAGAMSRMMQWLGRQYVGYINGRYRRTGTLWEGRYKSCLVDTERYLLTCYRYIELNLVRAAMVADPADYAWSSCRANAQALPDKVVMPHVEYLRLGTSVSERCVAYRQLFEEVLGNDRLVQIRAYVQQQRALGTPRFQREIEAMIGRCASVRAAHRPRRNKDAFGTGSDPP